VADHALERLLAALELCEKDDPERAATIVYFACLALWVQGRIEEQIALARRGVALTSGSTTTGAGTAHYMLGQALTMAGRSADAEQSLLIAHAVFLRLDGRVEAPPQERQAAFCLF